MLPGREETWLLRAILRRDASAGEAWEAFTSRISDVPSLFRTDTGGRKRLGPLLMASIRENGLPADPSLLTVLRTAYLREELRLDAFRRIAREAFQVLREAQIPFVVLKGAALAETVYPEGCFRHSHDIDLLLKPEDMEGAARALLDTGLAHEADLPGNRGVLLRHKTETPIVLLNQLYRQPFYQSDSPGLWARSREMELKPYGPVRVLSPADNLVHALTHASYCASRSNLLWAIDAWMLLHAPDPMDWDTFGKSVAATRSEIPAYVMLQYLGEELGAHIPGEVLGGLDVAANGRGDAALRRDVALRGARAHRGRHPSLSGLKRPKLTDRLSLVRWQLFPSAGYVEWAYADPPRALMPFIYLMRPFSFGARALKWRILGMVRSWTNR